jgi:hypothetical protein
MSELRFIAISSTLADRVRATGKSPGYGHPTYTELATGHGPCRHCLHTFEIGAERRTLFTYDPFHGLDPIPLPGPVFIHAEACERHDESSGFPQDLRSHPLTFAAYGDGRRLLHEIHVTDGVVEPVLERLFDASEVRYVHVRDQEAGCYDLRVERAKAAEAA